MKKASLIFGLIIVLLCSCSQSETPKDLFGRWTGIQSVSTRYQNEKSTFSFINDSLPVLIEIKNDGTVSGYVGNSKLYICMVSKNSGWLGKVFHIGTENGINGFLLGKFNIHDQYTVKIIKIPFTIKDSLMNGTIFMSNDNGMLPIVYVLKLKQE